MTREELRALARSNVATWPPLTPEQRDRLYVLLEPMREWLKEHAAEQRGDAA